MADVEEHAVSDDASTDPPGVVIDPSSLESSAGSSATGASGTGTGSLRLGMRIPHDLYDSSGILLLSSGSRITPRALFLISQRDERSVQAEVARPRATPKRVRKVQTEQIDQLLTIELSKKQILPSERISERPRLTLADLEAETQRNLERHHVVTEMLSDLCHSLERGKLIQADGVKTLVREFVDALSLDSDVLSAVVSMQETPGDFLFDHAANGCLLSMTMAAHLGLNRDQIEVIGLGALLRDVGMIKVPEAVRLAPRALSAQERSMIQRHPVYTLDCLEQIRGIPPIAKFIGYQSHERLDRSGYPRKRAGTTIHPFAQIVAIADAYAAMSHPRPHRPAMIPHEAIKQMLHDGAQNRFDGRLLSVFLDCVSAFPTGSMLQLNNGLVGKVVRANPGAHTRPVIIEVDSQGEPTKRSIDLSAEPTLSVVRAY
ncbi:MAG: hypothetical protein IID37_14280 [Planctomycetes bacterium]|nr:hypothetical protein [Planctomycetota bacterium]